MKQLLLFFLCPFIAFTQVQIGEDIDGEASGDRSGSVSLSSDGTIVAIGAPLNDDNGTNSGHVRVYENQGGTWVEVGEDIDGESAFDRSGSVSLSSDGTVVAIGASRNDGNGNDAGHVRVYDLSAVLSVESFKQDLYSVFVNDKDDIIEITLNDNQSLNQVNLYTVGGKYLYSGKSLELRTNSLQSGIYIVEVETDKGKSAKKVIVK